MFAGGSRRGRQRPRLCSSRRARPSASRAAGRSPATRSSGACRRCGPTSASTRWTRAIRTRPRSSTASCTAMRRATASTRRGTRSACGRRSVERHDPRPACSCPTSHDAVVCPTGFAGAGCSTWRCSPGGCSASPASTPRVARRAYDDTVARMHERTSLALTRSMAYHPEVQHHIAEMRINIEAMDAHLDRVCDDWSNGVDHGHDWPVKILACKYDVVNRRVVGRRHRARPHRRRRHLHPQPLRAAVP